MIATRSFACGISLALGCSASAALAQMPGVPEGDVTGFEVCFLQLMVDNTDNPLAAISGPVICGERNIPMRQTCDFIDYLTLDSRTACKADDLAFWQAQVAAREASAIADGRNGAGFLYDQGLDRCEEVAAEGEDPSDCLIEVNWRTTMEFMAADLLAGLEAGQ